MAQKKKDSWRTECYVGRALSLIGYDFLIK